MKTFKIISFHQCLCLYDDIKNNKHTNINRFHNLGLELIFLPLESQFVVCFAHFTQLQIVETSCLIIEMAVFRLVLVNLIYLLDFHFKIKERHDTKND